MSTQNAVKIGRCLACVFGKAWVKTLALRHDDPELFQSVHSQIKGMADLISVGQGFPVRLFQTSTIPGETANTCIKLVFTDKASEVEVEMVVAVSKKGRVDLEFVVSNVDRTGRRICFEQRLKSC